jgi:hypothetical protein
MLKKTFNTVSCYWLSDANRENLKPLLRPTFFIEGRFFYCTVANSCFTHRTATELITSNSTNNAIPRLFSTIALTPIPRTDPTINGGRTSRKIQQG